MDIANEAVVKFGTFEGKADVEYIETEGRFVIRKKASSGGTGFVVGMMFGALGRMIVNETMTGKEVGSFNAGEIVLAKTTAAKRKTTYYLYSDSSKTPYEITVETDTGLCAAMGRCFADRMVGIDAKQPGVKTPPVPTPAPVAPPVHAPAAPPVQPSFMPPVQPPAAPVQQASSTVALPVQPPVIEEISATVPAAPPVFHKPANALLCLRTGPLAGNNFQCAPGYCVTVGRDPSRCTLVLSQYSSVSAVHCRMDIGDHRVTVTDLNSSNGTFVNGNRLQPGQSVVTRAGDTVKLASDACVFLIYFEK